jgi:hypothetical protein
VLIMGMSSATGEDLLSGGAQREGKTQEARTRTAKGKRKNPKVRARQVTRVLRRDDPMDGQRKAKEPGAYQWHTHAPTAVAGDLASRWGSLPVPRGRFPPGFASAGGGASKAVASPRGEQAAGQPVARGASGERQAL